MTCKFIARNWCDAICIETLWNYEPYSVRISVESPDSSPDGCRTLNASSDSLKQQFLLACFSSCSHHVVDKIGSFIANDLIKSQQKTYASRPTYPDNSSRMVALRDYHIKSASWLWSYKLFFLQRFKGNHFVNTCLSYIPKAIAWSNCCSLLCLQSQLDLGWV